MSAALKRKTYFVDEQAIRRAKKLLGVSSDAEVIRIAVDRIEEMERFLKFVKKTKGSLPRGSFGV